jgi:hypothetical protein
MLTYILMFDMSDLKGVEIMSHSFCIKNRRIGLDYAPLVVAEIAKMRGGVKKALEEEKVTIQFAFGTIGRTNIK